MNTDDGSLYRITSPEEERAILEAQMEAIRSKQLPKRIMVPDADEERVVNMNRHERRAWAKQHAKRLAQEARR